MSSSRASWSIRVVIVEPEGRMNFGQVVRLCRNFGVEEVCVVNPRFDVKDPEVVEFAAGGADLLDRVRVADSLEKCLEGADLSVCTTAIAGAPDDPLRQAVTPRAIRWLAPPGAKLAIVFGRESVGLTRSELSSCSLISTVTTPSDYNVLNISHAVALYLYELLGSWESFVVGDRCSGDYVRVVEKYVEKAGTACGLSRDEVAALKHVIHKASLTRVECKVLYRFLKRVLAAYSRLAKLQGPPPEELAE